MKRKLKAIAAVLLVLVMFVSAMPIQLAAEAMTPPTTRYATPDGYNDHDYQKMVAFFEQTDENGVRNGEKLSWDYDPTDPRTWRGYDGDYCRGSIGWTIVAGEYRLYEIFFGGIGNYALPLELVGFLDVSGCTALTDVRCNSWGDIPNHRCIDNAIHTYAGVELRLACEKLMEQQGYPEPTGQAKITPAFNLPCRYVLHTVGPIISGRVTKEDKELLASCYRSCLELAAENGLENVAFCCISTGEFRFPNDLAAEIAVRTVKEYLKKQTSVKKVIFNVFKDLDKTIYEKLLRADGTAESSITGL